MNAGVHERLQEKGHAPWPHYRLPLEDEWLQLSKIYDTSTSEWCSATLQEIKDKPNIGSIYQDMDQLRLVYEKVNLITTDGKPVISENSNG